MMGSKPKVSAKVLLLPLEQIEPSPYQARTSFDQQELARLALSIVQNGLLQPVSVRKTDKNRYELVAGERRLRACKLAGLTEIPAIVCEYGNQQTAALGLLENMQRQGLDPFEQARGIKEVIELWGCTQKQAAERLGIAQPTLNNKLRLLSLTQQQQEYCISTGLTERHARAVLRLEGEAQRTAALKAFYEKSMNARQADIYIEKVLAGQADPKPAPRAKRGVMVRDVRIFVNTINHAVRMMVDAGVPASTKREDGDDYIEYVVRIPTDNAIRVAPTQEKKPVAVAAMAR